MSDRVSRTLWISRVSQIAAVLCCASLTPTQADDTTTLLPPIEVDAIASELVETGVVIQVPVDPLGPSELSELLATLPGVQVRSSGGLGAYSEASLRGSNGRQVQLLLDGLPLNTGGGEATSLSLVSPLLLDHVDVYQGRVPLGLGSGLAGSIDLRTPEQLGQPLRAAIRLGSFGERQLHIAAQTGPHLQLAAGTQRADNDFDYVNTYRAYDPDDPNRERSEARQNAGTEQTYGLLRYQGAVRVLLHAVDGTQELPTRLNAADTRTALDTRSYAMALSNRPDTTLSWSLSHRYTREHFRDPASELGLAAQDTVGDTHLSSAGIGGDYFGLAHHLQTQYQRYHSEDRLNALDDTTAERLTVDYGTEWHTGERWHLELALQTGWSQDQADDSEDDSYWRFEPSAGLSHAIGSCIAAGNLGHRERLPTFFERYGDRGLFKGNPALKPERAIYADSGLRCLLSGPVQRASVTLFGQELKDVISPTYNAQGIGRSVNTAKATIYGVEFSGGGRWAGFDWQLGGTWQHTEDRSEVRATRGQQLPGRYQQQLNTRLEHALGPLQIYYAFRYEAGQYYDSANLLEAATLRRHDIGLSGRIATLGWSLQWLNLADEPYEQFNGFPTPGRRIALAMTWPAAQ